MSDRLINALANKFVERAEALGLKGKKRDDAALDFWCGAAIALELDGRTSVSEILGCQAALIISVRGYIGVRQIAMETAHAVPAPWRVTPAHAAAIDDELRSVGINPGPGI